MHIGIDEADADLVPKPISDAPLPRKGPLPQDFQDALSIIFPGEKKPDGSSDNVAAAPAPPPPISSGAFIESAPNILLQSSVDDHHLHANMPTMLMPEDHSQHSLDIYAAFSVMGDTGSTMAAPLIQPDMSFAEDVDVPDPQSLALIAPPEEANVIDGMEEEVDEKTSRMIELDDLAMLGIDADDLAAQCM